MKKHRFLFSLIILIFISQLPVSGQEEKGSSLSAKGYLKFLQTGLIPNTGSEVMYDNLIHNRLIFKWFPNSFLNVGFEIRNRFFYGDFVKKIPGYSNLIDINKGYFDVSGIIVKDSSYVLHSAVDRAYLDMTFGKFQIRAGRQRINWSQNLVWNPNDVFNAYSFFDFDYEERPGVDAIRVQYYPGLTSSAEMVYEIGDDIEKMSLAGLYRFNRGNFDYQFLGGYVKNDWILGTGWSGNLGGAAYRGELTWFYSNNDTLSQRSNFVGAVSGDYTFTNKLYIHIAVLYNNNGSVAKAPFSQNLFFTNLSAKSLTPARTEFLAQLTYPVTPLVNSGLSTIINPFDHSFFLGPSVSISLMDNLELLFTGQFFAGPEGTQYGDIGNLLYWRIKWSF